MCLDLITIIHSFVRQIEAYWWHWRLNQNYLLPSFGDGKSIMVVVENSTKEVFIYYVTPCYKRGFLEQRNIIMGWLLKYRRDLSFRYDNVTLETNCRYKQSFPFVQLLSIANQRRYLGFNKNF